MEAVETAEVGIGTSTKKHKIKISTLICQRVRKLEEMGRDPGPHNSLRKVKKLRDKPGPGVQISIKRFLLNADDRERREGDIREKTLELKPQSLSNQKATKPRKPLRQEASNKTKLATVTSRPARGSPL